MKRLAIALIVFYRAEQFSLKYDEKQGTKCTLFFCFAISNEKKLRV